MGFFVSTLYTVLVPAVLVRGGFLLVEDFRVDDMDLNLDLDLDLEP